MNHWVVVLFLLAFIGIVVGAVFAWRADRKRRDALRALAAENGWSYIGKDRHDRPDRYKGYEPFGQGHTRYASNIIGGRADDAGFEIFDYHYAVTRRSGKTTTTDHHHFKMATIDMPIPAPGLLIRDEHLGHKIFDALGGEDIDFESHEFSRRFWVRCPDRRFAYDVIHPGTMEFLLANTGWTWQWRGRTLMLHRTGKMTPPDVHGMLRLMTDLRGLVPRHLLAASR